MAAADPAESFRRQLLEAGALESDAAVLTPITGGVSSDIYLAEDGDRRFVVKRALPRLKVADEWFADISRNRFELAYLETVGAFLPDAVPRILDSDPDAGWFAMELLDGFANWKTLLLKGCCDPEQARKAARVLATIHRKTWDDAEVRAEFESTENFHQLRIDPYLLTSAERSDGEALAAEIRFEARRLRDTRRCLVHGDYSPKNLLFRGDRLAVIDCEVAWFGDPAFDVAFLLNHLLLKALYLEEKSGDLVGMALAAWGEYADTLRNRERVSQVSQPLCRLLPMLMLARIDGKSPVEYLADESKRQLIRDFTARSILKGKPDNPDTFMIDWLQTLTETLGSR